MTPIEQMIVDRLKNIASIPTSAEQGCDLSEDMINWTTAEIYNAGLEDGKTLVARIVLASLGIEFDEEQA